MNRDPSDRVNTRFRAGISSTLIFCACALLLPGRCFASEVTVTITDPSQTATPGQTLDFTGTITNMLLGDGTFTISFSPYNPNLTVTPELPSPFSIGFGATTSTIDIFNVTLDSTIGPGTYPVDFVVTGCTSGDADCRGADGDVTITVTPEPSTLWLMATGLIVFATTLPGFIWKKSKQAAQESV
jgi:PEP-CTERM motif